MENERPRSSNIKRTVVVVLTTLGIVTGVFGFTRWHAAVQRDQCIQNLRQIDGAKQQWALENVAGKLDKVTGKPITENSPAFGDAVPTEEDVDKYVLGRGGYPFPECPAGGHYTIGRIADAPTCSIPGHVLP